ncbi:MAG: low molecular weight phosphotyrosine protein phosphatase [Ferruginibacter sp.]|nr:low molecular weight phosphotyrosine protein phosphatase [Chitinophagaceae bacterium]MBP6286474.1 low molecular weight phosphotyrosine protein phosphatase [Ferruginibacter sp.]
MVCLGNICRSPMAEGILQDRARKAGLNWTVESAGTNGYHTGEPPHHLGIKVARENGVDISNQRSRRFMADDLEQFDRIYAMANDVLEDIKRISRNKFNATKVDLFLNEVYPGEDRDVPDPWYGGEQDFHEAYKLIDEVCELIVRREQSVVSSRE